MIPRDYDFPEKVLSKTIKVGKGTANDVSNSVTLKNAGYADIPTLDRQYEEGVGNEFVWSDKLVIELMESEGHQDATASLNKFVHKKLKP